MIIAIPSNHEHLADALVRDLGFTRVHVDAPLRELALKIDPLVEQGPMLVNMHGAPRLSARLDACGGDWGKAIERAPEIARFLDALREHVDPQRRTEGDTVIVGVERWTLGDRVPYGNTPSGASGSQFVAIRGRVAEDAGVNLWLDEGPTDEHEKAIVEYVKELRQPRAGVAVAPPSTDD